MSDRIPYLKLPGQGSHRYYESTRGRREDIKFYQSKAWRAVRAAHLADNPLCEECLRNEQLTPATMVHHVVERKQDPSRALDRTNLESLCNPCHTSLHKGNGTTEG